MPTDHQISNLLFISGKIEYIFYISPD